VAEGAGESLDETPFRDRADFAAGDGIHDVLLETCAAGKAFACGLRERL
jgi:hypothetical protein